MDLQQVQADEIVASARFANKAKIQGWYVWMAIMVSTRLWLGGVVSQRRDKDLIEALAAKVRKVALYRSLLLLALD